MHVEEGADILFLDSPADDAEIHRAITAAARPPVLRRPLSRRRPRDPYPGQATAFGFKIGTFPTGLLSPAAAGIKAGLAALAAGELDAASAMPQAELREALGWAEYDAQAKRFMVPD